MEEAAESAPFLVAGIGGGDRILEDSPHEGIPESDKGGKEGGISLQPGEFKLPLQCPGLARKFGPWQPLDATARPEDNEAQSGGSQETAEGSLLEVTE